MHKVIQLISNFLYNKNMPHSMKVHVHRMNLKKNWIIQKFQNLKILKEKAARQRTHFFNHLIKIMFNGFKMSNFKCKSHMKEINLSKNMFSYPLKLILGFFEIFYIFDNKPEYSYTIMYECEKSPITHELSYIGVFNFLHLSLFHVNVICKK
jgi:hypothetical protein